MLYGSLLLRSGPAGDVAVPAPIRHWGQRALSSMSLTFLNAPSISAGYDDLPVPTVRAWGQLTMQHTLSAEGFGVRLRPVQMEDAAFIVWLRNLDHVRGRVGDSATDTAGQQAWLEAYFEREGDYYFIIETLAGNALGFPMAPKGVMLRGLLFAVGLALLSGLPPALRAMRLSVVEALAGK